MARSDMANAKTTAPKRRLAKEAEAGLAFDKSASYLRSFFARLRHAGTKHQTTPAI